jgi:hypothetical protein
MYNTDNCEEIVEREETREWGITMIKLQKWPIYAFLWVLEEIGKQ